jgi:hypothetical protein
MRLSKWFQSLEPPDQAMVTDALDFAAEGAIFGFFCVLDGARVIENEEEKGTFEIFYAKGEQRVLLNPPDDDLHDIFQSMRAFD